MTKMKWTRSSSAMTYESKPLTEQDGSELYDDAVMLRHQLIDSLADLNPDMMEHVINSSSYDDISADVIKQALHSVTVQNKAVPVLLGSALKNCAIQPLLGAIVDYLPNPEKNNNEFSYQSDQNCAFAFKTVHEPQRGAVTFVRIYGGALSKSASVYNATQEYSEKIGNLYTILGDQLMETKTISAGNIAGVTGINKTITGDTLVSSASALRKFEKSDKALPSLTIPEPVFMCSVEPYSTRDQKKLDMALKCLIREDPSLRVKTDVDSGQMVISGMGELHLDIVKDRLMREYKVETYFGPTLVAYRECIRKESPIIHHTLENDIEGIHNHVTVSLEVVPVEGGLRRAEFIGTATQSWSDLKWFIRKPINHGVSLALSAGPLLSYPVVDCGVNIYDFQLHSRRTSPAIMSAAVSQAIHKALMESDPCLSEPIMSLQIYCEEEHIGDILQDLAQRRAIIGETVHKSDGVTINARSPVATLVKYSTDLRRISSGRAHFMMEIDGYSPMTSHQTEQIISSLTGGTLTLDTVNDGHADY